MADGLSVQEAYARLLCSLTQETETQRVRFAWARGRVELHQHLMVGVGGWGVVTDQPRPQLPQSLTGLSCTPGPVQPRFPQSPLREPIPPRVSVGQVPGRKCALWEMPVFEA